MPIRAERKALYPSNWKALRAEVLSRASNACEGSPRFPECRAVNYEPHPVTGSKVVLTIAHLNHDETCADPAMLRAWCQRCHLVYDASHHAKNAAETRRRKLAIADLFAGGEA
jgi:hypothetical protein